MKTLNFLAIMTICLMAISHVSGTYYIIKTFENNDKTSGEEGQLSADGLKRVDCFVGLIGSKVNEPQAIFYKKTGTDKNGAEKINSRQFTAEQVSFLIIYHFYL